MADVAESVGGDATDVHADLFGDEGLENLLLLGHGIVEPELGHL